MLFKNDQTTRWNQPLPLYLRIQHKFPRMYMIDVFVPLIYLYHFVYESFPIGRIIFFNFGIFSILASFSILAFSSILASFSVQHLFQFWYCSALTPLVMNKLQSRPFWDLRDLKKERHDGGNHNPLLSTHFHPFWIDNKWQIGIPSAFLYFITNRLQNRPLKIPPNVQINPSEARRLWVLAQTEFSGIYFQASVSSKSNQHQSRTLGKIPMAESWSMWIEGSKFQQ